MAQAGRATWLSTKVDEASDHILGPPAADITLVEYGSYACSHCRAATESIAGLRDEFGSRLRYVFRYRPLPDVDIARRAADLAERATDPDRFWKVHVALMTRSPTLLYRLVLPAGPWAHGWGVPMATDTAFAVAIIAVMGRRVPIELRVFLTAAIVDDIGAIVVVALFYSQALHLWALAGAVVTTGLLALLNRANVYRVTPYLVLGLVLWACVHEGGLHATLAGVVLALFILTRQPPNLAALTAQANAILAIEARRSTEVLRHGPSTPAMEALDAIHDRLESPADRMLRTVSLRSNYVVLPVFALANAGVSLHSTAFTGHGSLMFAIVLGLAVGKPIGLLSASALAVRLGIAVKPDEYSWRQLAGAGALAGIGFTMSLFIAGQAFADPGDFAAAKIAVFAASVIAAGLGSLILWSANGATER